MSEAGPEPEWEIPEAELHPSLLVRVVLWICGSIALLLGIIGIVVPGLPTTPFILVAAACYARASERFYRWLVHNPTFAPQLKGDDPVDGELTVRIHFRSQ